MAAQPETRVLLTHVDRVQILRGQYASASLRGGTIAVMVNPNQGLAGRPTSPRLNRARGGPASRRSILAVGGP